ncbi:MAG: hypothetical protein GX050_02150 [Firmicutes bacterium]|nr:hypothetical protein [Bacillota bacterium]
MLKIKLNPWFFFLLFISGVTGKILSLVVGFLSVLLHETAHLLTALGFGYHSLAIELFPFGGVAKMDYALFNDPVAEGITALAGPVESILLALLGKAFAPYLQIPEISEALITINCGLALFNLLPLFPLDGGRMLRAFLASKLGYKKATVLVTTLTRRVIIVSGFPLIILTLRGVVPPHFPFLLFFLFVAARQDNFFYAYLTQKDYKTRLLEEKGLLASKVWVVEPGRKVGEIIPFLSGKNYHLFILTDKNGKIVGEVTEEQLFMLMKEENAFHIRFAQVGSQQKKGQLLPR